MEETVEATCPQCGATITVFVDPGNGMTQRLIEDCQVCCRANELTVRYDRRERAFTVDAKAVDL